MQVKKTYCVNIFLESQLDFSGLATEAVKALATGGSVGHYPFDDHHKITPFKAAVRLKSGGFAESAAFKHLGIQDKTARLPVQEFHSVAMSVDEDIDVPVKWITTHLVAHKSGECMEALAHVGGLGIEPVTHAVVKTEHDSQILYKSAQQLRVQLPVYPHHASAACPAFDCQFLTLADALTTRIDLTLHLRDRSWYEAAPRLKLDERARTFRIYLLLPEITSA